MPVQPPATTNRTLFGSGEQRAGRESAPSRRLDDGGDARLEDLQARTKAERIEGGAQIASALAEMRPSLGMHGHNHGVGKGARGFDGVIGVHREMERPAGLRRAR